jgi:sigma-B regulation protein RsbU (phosphoserine phosphatase)
VTCFYGVLDTSSGWIENEQIAGHNPPFVLHADGRLDATPQTGGFMLGCSPERRTRPAPCSSRPAIRSSLYTDGITKLSTRATSSTARSGFGTCLQRAAASGPVSAKDIVEAVTADVASSPAARRRPMTRPFS